jgi:hypothetical protein
MLRLSDLNGAIQIGLIVFDIGENMMNSIFQL